jgi:hypothetical protein
MAELSAEKTKRELSPQESAELNALTKEFLLLLLEQTTYEFVMKAQQQLVEW